MLSDSANCWRLNVAIRRPEVKQNSQVGDPSNVREEIRRQILILNEALKGAVYCGANLMFRVTRMLRYYFNFSPHRPLSEVSRTPNFTYFWGNKSRLMKKEFHCKHRMVNGNFCLVFSAGKLGSLVRTLRRIQGDAAVQRISYVEARCESGTWAIYLTRDNE